MLAPGNMMAEDSLFLVLLQHRNFFDDRLMCINYWSEVLSLTELQVLLYYSRMAIILGVASIRINTVYTCDMQHVPGPFFPHKRDLHEDRTSLHIHAYGI